MATYQKVSGDPELQRFADPRRVQVELSDELDRERTSEELARARVAADGARRLKAEFAAKISHELRTPLNLVIGFSEMLMTAPRADDPLGSAHSGEVALPEIYRDDVEAIYRNAQHLSTLIDDVLELGEIEAGRMGLRKEWTSAADIVEEATAVVRSLLVDRGLTATVAVPADLPSIFVDRTRIRQVLINLLINAARFTDQGGVRIGGRVDGHDLVVTVADTGVGISSRDLPLVFEEFRQFETALQRRAGGSGLGLAICKTLVELHGGNIWVESTPGRGTTVSFALPLTQNVAAQPLRAPWETWAHLTAVPKHEARSIVVLSHDPGQARIFQRHLDGFEIVPATDPQSVPDTVSAIAVVRVLGEHDDLQVAAKDAERLGTRAPLVLCRMPSARDVRRQMRVFDYLVKPFTRDQLLAVVARLPRPPQRVLVADDDADMTALITRVLRSDARDRHVFAAADGASTLELLHRPRPRLDLLILDLAMPAPDGFAILQEIRATPRLSHLPVIVVSARAFSERGVTASVLAVTRASGLTVRELMGCTRALVDTLAPD